jgi:hypothetical protein
MTVVGRMMGGAVLWLAMVAGGGTAFADGNGGVRGGGGLRDGGAHVGSLYGAADVRDYGGFGSAAGADRLGHYGRPLSPFPCPYPMLFVVPNGGSGPR